jgi:hypothetical protein
MKKILFLFIFAPFSFLQGAEKEQIKENSKQINLPESDFHAKANVQLAQTILSETQKGTLNKYLKKDPPKDYLIFRVGEPVVGASHVFKADSLSPSTEKYLIHFTHVCNENNNSFNPPIDPDSKKIEQIALDLLGVDNQFLPTLRELIYGAIERCKTK